MASSSKVIRVKPTKGKKTFYCPKCKRRVRDDTPHYNAHRAIQCDVCNEWLHQRCAELDDEKFAEFQNDKSLPFYCSECEAQKQKSTTRKRKSEESVCVESKKPKRQPLKRIDNDSTSKKKLVPHTILSKYKKEIVHNFSKNPTDIMHELIANGFISTVCSQRFSSMNVEEQAVLLYDACHCEVENHPQQFKKLMSFLESKRYAESLLYDLRQAYLKTTVNNEIRPCPPSKGPLLSDSSVQSAASFVPTDDPITASTYWGISDCDMNGSGEVIAILDTGITESAMSDINLLDFCVDNQKDEDPSNHGTKVAIVAGSAKTLILQNTWHTCGVAPGAKLAIFKVSTNKTSPYSVDRVLESLEIIRDHNEMNEDEGGRKIRIIVMPFKLPKISYYKKKEIEDVLAQLQFQGVICVAAAGNSGKTESPCFPAKSEKVLTVGSVNAFGKFSKFSSDHDCIDVLAPGTNIFFGEYYDDDECIVTDNGTSFAAPAVAGLVARLFQCAREYGDNEILSRLSNLSCLKKFLKENLCIEDKLLQPEKVLKFFKNPDKIVEFAIDLD